MSAITAPTDEGSLGTRSSRMLKTERLLLRDFHRDDFMAVHAYASDPAVSRFMAWGPNAPQDTALFIDRVVSEATQCPRENFNLAITLRDSGELIGGCGLDLAPSGGHEFVLGYCLASRYWRAGYGTEAVRALVAFGFSELRADRIVAHVFTGNVASQAILRRLGFVNVAVMAKHVYVRGEWHDEYQFVRSA